MQASEKTNWNGIAVGNYSNLDERVYRTTIT